MMTKAERADIKKLVAEIHPDTGIVILRKPGVRLFTRKSSGPEPRFATFSSLMWNRPHGGRVGGTSDRTRSTMPREIRAYTVGKTVHRGQPIPHEVVPVVTAVPSRELAAFMGERDRVALRRHLRRLRADGVLIAPQPGRLQAKVRGVGNAYVFRGAEADVARVWRPSRRARVGLV